MSILYNDEQQAIAEGSRRALEPLSDPKRPLALLESIGVYDRDFWTTAVDMGWAALALPEEYGGLNLSLVELGLVAQACGAATAGAPFLTMSYGCAKGLLHTAAADLQHSWLSRLASGEAKGTVAFGEGNDILPQPSAVTFAAGRLDGTKHGVVGGLAADVALVCAMQEDEPVLVLAELSGSSRKAVEGFDNSRLTADIEFAGTPATLVSRGTEAIDAARRVLAEMAVVTAHEQAGGAEALLKIARDFALTRRAFGQPIGAFQSIKHRIAELYALVEIAKANCIHAAASEHAPSFLIAAADARLSATEAYDTAARDCIQIHGGIGVTWEHGLHVHMRRARSLAIEHGNMFFWEDLLVTELTGEQA